MKQDTKHIEIGSLKGKKLLGFMQLKDTKEYPFGEWDNALALYTDKGCFVLRSDNQDYSCYDTWLLEQVDIEIPKDIRYKTISEKIISVKDSQEAVKDWTNEHLDQYWLEIKTKTKILRFGHHWNDCHYPNSIWEEI